jgi:hypothetical protein
MTCGESVQDMKCVFHDSLQRLFAIFLACINIWRGTLEIHVKIYASLYVQLPLLFEFNPKWNKPTNFSKSSRSIHGRGKFFSSPQRPDGLWAPPSKLILNCVLLVFRS